MATLPEVATAEEQEESRLEADDYVDLNSASQDLLETLSGIGPKLAARIIAYRHIHGPFASVDDITRIPGIGPSLLQRLRPRLAVTYPAGLDRRVSGTVIEQKGDEMAENVDLEEQVTTEVSTADVSASDVPAEASAEESGGAARPDEDNVLPSPIIEGGQPDTEAGEETVMPSSDSEAVETEEATTEQKAEIEEGESSEAPIERARSPKRDAWLWPALIGTLAGAVLGAALALLIFAAINGAVDIRNSAAVLTVEGNVSDLKAEMNAVQSDMGILQGDVEGLRERVDVLSGLTPRMDAVEQTVTTLEKSTTDLHAKVDTLDTTVSQLEANVKRINTTLEAVQAQTQKAMDFFDGLRSLLGRIFGSATPEPESRSLPPRVMTEVAA